MKLDAPSITAAFACGLAPDKSDYRQQRFASDMKQAARLCTSTGRLAPLHSYRCTHAQSLKRFRYARLAGQRPSAAYGRSAEHISAFAICATEHAQGLSLNARQNFARSRIFALFYSQPGAGSMHDDEPEQIVDTSFPSAA
jgi:hypothetical protein